MTSVPLAKWSSGRKRGLGIGGIFFLPITQVLIDAGSWRTIWVVMAVAFMALSIPLSAIFLRRQPEDIGLEVDGRPGVPVESRVTGQATGSVPEEMSWTVQEAFRTATM